MLLKGGPFKVMIGGPIRVMNDNPNGWEDQAKVRPLHFAAQHNTIASAKVLIKAGAMVSAETSEGITPLEIAILHSHPDMVALLRD